MNLSATGHLPDPVYLRLLEYQKRRGVYPAYAADLPLLFFISFSRIAAGLSILSVFFPASPLEGVGAWGKQTREGNGGPGLIRVVATTLRQNKSYLNNYYLNTGKSRRSVGRRILKSYPKGRVFKHRNLFCILCIHN